MTLSNKSNVTFALLLGVLALPFFALPAALAADPVAQYGTVAPITTQSTTTVTTTTTSAEPGAMPGATPGVTTKVLPPGEIPATTRAVALEQARLGAGRSDPFTSFAGYKPFPVSQRIVPQHVVKRQIPAFVPLPPPPPGGRVMTPGATASGSSSHGLVMPPAPVSEGVPISELPLPPDRPSVVAKLKLVGIIGDRALLTFTDPMFRAENHFPPCISLGSGEQLESVSVIDVTPHSIVLEEDGERQTKELPRIR